MNNKDFTTSFITGNTPQEVFDAVNNVRGWWSENVEGVTDQRDEEFLYYYKDVHICKMRIAELVPGKRVAWLVLDNEFNFTKDKSEWKGNKIVFDIAEQDGKTVLTFTHHGLVPEYECYNVCHDAWTSYIQGSLKSLVETGKGRPNTQEGGLNAELIEKWQLHKK
ncbi:MAG: SRPBCC domain-containing protein [Bacteroidota bacterium]